jgi:hypothetical protein
MLAPAGALTRLNRSVFAGRSGSVAEAVNVSVPPSFTVRLLNGASTGGWFTSLTVTVTDRSANRLGLPLSVTRTVKV